MNRRESILGLLALGATPLTAEGQEKKKLHRIGVLSSPVLSALYIDAIRQGLREHGYVEGKNLRLEWRIADGNPDTLSKFAAELVRMNVDVIVAVAGPAAIAAKRATAAIPIVFTIIPDPVGYGLVRTLGRPDGNLTGLSAVQFELIGKGLELLKEVLPSLKFIAMINNPGSPGRALFSQLSQSSAAKLSLDVRNIEVRDFSELVSALTDIGKMGAQAVVLMPDALFFTYRTQIIDFATQSHLPVLGWQRQFAEGGALISYGANFVAMYRRTGYFVDRILKGTKPADLPVEQPTKFELVVNLKTAKTLGLVIPKSVLVRADEVIQ